MTSTIPAQVGVRLEDAETPALLVDLDDLDGLERNLERLVRAVEPTGVRIRPHAKTDKCPEIALRQVAAGAIGVCCQSVGEAEVMVGAGVDDVLVSNQVVDPPKIARLATLARQARLGICANQQANIIALNQAASAAGTRLDVLVEIAVGTGQCGVEPGKPALALARQISESSHLRFAGLQAYHGRAQHIRDYDERRKAVSGAAEMTERTASLLERSGIACETVTGAGTGTFPFEAASSVYSEIQPGSYVFMDADYAQNRNEGGSPFDFFEFSLFVYASVISRPVPERAIINAGKKAVSVDSGMPLVHEMPRTGYAGAADEHGRLILAEADRGLAVRDKVRQVPGHCDPTVILYDWLVGVRAGRVESVWPIEARGASI